MSDLLLAVVAAIAGYAAGRLRPLHSARDWAWWTVATYGETHTSTRRMLAALALQPGLAWEAWRRNDPPQPCRAPARLIDPTEETPGA